MVIPVYDKNPVRRTPVVTYALIGLCVLIFLIGPSSGLNPLYGVGHEQVCAQATYFARWGVIPARLWHGRVTPGEVPMPDGCPPLRSLAASPFLSVLTAMFLHGSWVHLLGNMLFFYVFGDNVESRMGGFRFLLFYVASGYLATYGYALAHVSSAQTLVGASGAISGVLGAYLFLYPRARVTSVFPFLFFLPLRFPAWMVLIFWFVLQWLSGEVHQTGPGVAYLAHITGFLFGFLCTWVCYRATPKLEPAARATRGDLQP
jgi:membrane associated rhomboid family serine protease